MQKVPAHDPRTDPKDAKDTPAETHTTPHATRSHHPTTAYFKTANASRPISVGKLRYQFETTQRVGGVWAGIFSTSNHNDIVALRSAAGKANGVEEIEKEQFEDIAKKKASSSAPFHDLSPIQSNQTQAQRVAPGVVAEVAAEKVEEPTPPPAVNAPRVVDIDATARIGRVPPVEVHDKGPGTGSSHPRSTHK